MGLQYLPVMDLMKLMLTTSHLEVSVVKIIPVCGNPDIRVLIWYFLFSNSVVWQAGVITVWMLADVGVW